MKASELVGILNTLPDLEVVVDGYEGGTDPLLLENIGVVYVDKCAGQAYLGKYGDATLSSPSKPPESWEEAEDWAQVIILSRRGY